MNDHQRTEIVLITVEETLDRLRDRHDPMLEEYIARLERIQADLAAHIATLERMHAHLAARLGRRGCAVTLTDTTAANEKPQLARGFRRWS